jgi:hypothetical protein
VSGPRGRRRAVGSPRQELAEATEVGGLYLRRLVRAQLGLSLSALVAFGGPVRSAAAGALHRPRAPGRRRPRRPARAPARRADAVPFFLAIGWLYQRRADALDAAFRELADPP